MLKKTVNFVLIVMIVSFAGGCSLSSRVKRADKQFATGEYYAAGASYKSLFSKIPAKNKELRSHIAYNQAECYRILNYSNAEQMYNNAIRFSYPDSLVFLRYAQVLQRNGKYPDAVKNFKTYLTKDSNNIVAKNGLNFMDSLQKFRLNPNIYVVKKMDAFNSRRSYTFSPSFLNSDGDVLYFSSNRSFNNKVVQKSSTVTGLQLNSIYSVRKDAAGKWEKPIKLDAEINMSSSDNGACSFSTEGNIMFFTRANQQNINGLGSQIYVSNRAGGTWSEAKLLQIFKDSTISVGHPSLAPDGETLYFVSDHPRGKGGKDIWKAKYRGGECTEVENLGAEINTPADEMFPSVRQDGTLYFSSNGHAGLGGLDIFKAVHNAENGWTVINMGIPVNSNADDFGITFEGNNEKGFFTSNRSETRGYDAIWSFELPVYEYILEGKVTDESATPIPEAWVKMVSDNGLNVKVQTKKDGSYRMKIEKNIDCVLLASARGFLNMQGKINIPEVSENKIFTQNFQLSTIYKPVQVENIFYEFGKWDLTPSSEEGLKMLTNILITNPNITIEISAHTDFVGNNESNKILSQKRAKSVVDYLIAKGIPSARLTSAGYGEEKPYIVDEKTAQKYPFLKVNDELNESFVTKLTPEQQEIANQINRRTEFRVLKTNYK